MARVFRGGRFCHLTFDGVGKGVSHEACGRVLQPGCLGEEYPHHPRAGGWCCVLAWDLGHGMVPIEVVVPVLPGHMLDDFR